MKNSLMGTVMLALILISSCDSNRTSRKASKSTADEKIRLVQILEPRGVVDVFGDTLKIGECYEYVRKTTNLIHVDATHRYYFGALGQDHRLEALFEIDKLDADTVSCYSNQQHLFKVRRFKIADLDRGSFPLK